MKGISKKDRLFYYTNDLILLVLILVVLYPIIYIISSSFSSPSATMAGKVWLLPVEPGIEGYKAVFKNSSIIGGYCNTLFYTVVGTLISMFLTVITAYPLARKDFKPRNVMMYIFTFTMFFSGGMIPSYILITKIGFYNTRWAMIIPGALSVYNMIIMRTSFEPIVSSEIHEAAKIDGCSDVKFLISILLPLSKAVIAVITLFYAIGQWNAFFNALLYLKDKKLYPLQLVLRDILTMNTISVNMITDADEMAAKQGLSELLKYALIVVASVPVMIIYPFIQRFFVKGIMIGSIKG